jgi:type II secretory pathway pseudopilin PulG
MRLTHRTRRRAQRGFTYFMLLWWVALSGLVLAALSQQWRFERQREKEAEMVARAEEIRQALTAYHEMTPGGQVGSWPARLADLLEDRRGPSVRRHLRRLWVDPLTGKPEWGLVRESATAPGIQGVYSLATARPIRAPAGISSYAEWRFEGGAPPDGP